jgi:hypothetical protein
MGTVTLRNLSHVQAQLGGSNPISLSEYYRGGAFVPSLRNVTVFEPAGGGWTYQNPPATLWADLYADDGKGASYWKSQIYWEGPVIHEFVGVAVTTVTVGSFTYYKGPGVSSGLFDQYQIRRTSPGQISINTGVPSSGPISLNQLLGAENP